MTTEEVQQALIALGSTPQEVHDALLAAGCKGVPLDQTNCPISTFLRLKCSVISPRVIPNTGWRYGEKLSIPLPTACNEFALAFDEQKFPDLILE